MKAVNLLPPDLRGALKSPATVAAAGEPAGGSGAFVVLGALALCVVALAGYVLTTNTIRQREADVAQLEARNASLMAESARLKPYADFQSVAQARIATVRDLATQRFDWEQSLRDLSRALPQDVTVKKLGASVSSQSSSGGVDSQLRSALDVPAIQIDGCTSDQNAVARMMARLRGVDGVTRVSLQRSTKPAVAEGSVIDTASVDVATGCDDSAGSPPDFSVLVFFQNDAAAAAAPSADVAAAPKAAAGSSTGSGSAQSVQGAAATTTASTASDGAK